MRLAHLATDLGPVDFCYREAKSSSFQGPVLGGGIGGPGRDGGAADGGDASAGGDALDGGAGLDGAADDGGPAGSDAGPPSVGYRSVSKYLVLGASGPLTIALVAPNATSCASPLLSADVTLDPGKLSTVAIVGRARVDGGEAGLGLVAFIDDRTTVPTKARVRVIHAALGTTAGRAPAGALSVRAAASQTVSVADRLEPRKAASPSDAVPVDALGYATIEPVPPPLQLAVGAAAGEPPTDASHESWLSDPGELDLRGGSLHTGFVLSGDARPFLVLWCTDTSTTGEQTTCALVR